MFVRTASKQDLEAVRALLVATWHDTYDSIYGAEAVTKITNEWHSIQALSQYLKQPASEFLVADDGKRIGGVAFASTVDSGRTVQLFQLYVLPALQGQGIGGLLLDEVEGCFPEADKIRLEVAEENKKAVDFYFSQGFSKVGTNASDKNTLGLHKVVVFERPIVWAE